MRTAMGFNNKIQITVVKIPTIALNKKDSGRFIPLISFQTPVHSKTVGIVREMRNGVDDKPEILGEQKIFIFEGS